VEGHQIGELRGDSQAKAVDDQAFAGRVKAEYEDSAEQAQHRPNSNPALQKKKSAPPLNCSDCQWQPELTNATCWNEVDYETRPSAD
jgi:hypothetical protein